MPNFGFRALEFPVDLDTSKWLLEARSNESWLMLESWDGIDDPLEIDTGLLKN